jgi:hypothetical protein
MESPKGWLTSRTPWWVSQNKKGWKHFGNTLYKSVPPNTHQESVSPTTPKKNLGAFHVWANEMNE